jgi:hypothetical protein
LCPPENLAIIQNGKTPKPEEDKEVKLLTGKTLTKYFKTKQIKER